MKKCPHCEEKAIPLLHVIDSSPEIGAVCTGCGKQSSVEFGASFLNLLMHFTLIFYVWTTIKSGSEYSLIGTYIVMAILIEAVYIWTAPFSIKPDNMIKLISRSLIAIVLGLLSVSVIIGQLNL
ncbi:hypothetical protein [Alkalimarinus alittae]|uniref:DUF983 domain-containing protein n=1 Tax=Alkalimarinus alittae TaxID=2961619 RepID=A0ABY6N599_9ALTE|nr:hypothetical protein [Alkalimarinus alittae]UZE97185.1 hypothetical protein NKI27_05405 [Alkalimarinus alittae]